MNKESFSSSLYIVDYTKYNQDHADEPSKYSGVVFHAMKPDNIHSFVLDNPRNVSFEAVNLEHNPALMKREDGSMSSQCECLLFAEENRSWMMFLELKYCHTKNVLGNIENALWQIKRTYGFLLSERRSQIDVSNYQPYFVISTPDVSSDDVSSLYDGFIWSQDDLLEIKNDYGGARLFHCNEVMVESPYDLSDVK